MTQRTGPNISSRKTRIDGFVLSRMAGVKKGPFSRPFCGRPPHSSFAPDFTPSCRVFFAAANFGSRALKIGWGALDGLLTTVSGVGVALMLGIVLVSTAVPTIRTQVFGPPQSYHWIALALAQGIVLYTLVVSTVFEMGNPRYRHPTVLLIWLSAFLAFEFWSWFRSVSGQRRER